MADSAAAARMAAGGIGWVIVGSDRIAANGDVANKIGTYGLAVAARHHGVRFMVAAPTSTIDKGNHRRPRDSDRGTACARGPAVGGQRIAAEGAGARNPVTDVTPAELVDAIVTERGIIEAPGSKAKLAAHMGAA